MFQRLSNLVRGFFSLFISGLERQNPEALLEVEQENLRKQIGQYNQGLASHAGLCERLISQVKQLENEQRDLRAKTTANLRAGNRDCRGSICVASADSRARTGRRIARSWSRRRRLTSDLVKARDVAINAARQKIESLKASISDLKMKQAHGRADRDGFGHDHQHRRFGRDTRPAAQHRRGRAAKSRRTSPGRARLARHLWRHRQRSRTESTRRAGAGGFRREGRHSAGSRRRLPQNQCSAGAVEIDGTGQPEKE